MAQVQISFDSAQHIGKREEQQDACGVFTETDHARQAPFLFLLADGMGGLQYGKEAAELAIETIVSSFSSKKPETPIQEALEDAARSANEKIYRMADKAGCAGEAGTTLIACALQGSTLYWVSVGDSRIYLFRNNTLQQLNEEHNLRNRLAALAAKGLFPIDDIETNPQKEALTSFIGIETLKEIDGENRELLLEPGDHVLLCSDGLFKTLNSKEIIGILNGAKQEKIASQLVKSTINRDAPHQDNVSVVHLQYPGKRAHRSHSEITTEQRNKKKPSSAGLAANTSSKKEAQPEIRRKETGRDFFTRTIADSKKKTFLWMFLAVAFGACLASYRIFFTAR